SRRSDGRGPPTAGSGAGVRSASGRAAEELLEEPVVLEEEVELDQVVPGERRALGDRSPRVGLGGPRPVRVPSAVAPGNPPREQKAPDPLVPPLLYAFPARGADERVDPVEAVLEQVEQDLLGPDVHLAAPWAHRSDDVRPRLGIG